MGKKKGKGGGGGQQDQGPPGQQRNQGPPPGQQRDQGPPPGQQGGQGPPPGQQQGQGPPPGGQQGGQGPPPAQQQGQGPPPGQQRGQGPPPAQQQGQGPQPGQQRGQGPPRGRGQQQQGRGRGDHQGPSGPPGMRTPAPQQGQHPQGQGPPFQQGGPRPPGPPFQQGQHSQGPPSQHGGPRPRGPPFQQGGPRPQDPQFQQTGQHPHVQQGGPRPQDPQFQQMGQHPHVQQGGPRPQDPQFQQMGQHPHVQQGGPRPQDPPPQQAQSSLAPSQPRQSPQGPQSPERPPSQQGGQQKGSERPLSKQGFGDVSKVADSVSRMSMVEKKFTIPMKKDFKKDAKQGRPIPLEVNHLKVQVRPAQSQTENIHHYDVSIDPDKPKRLMRAAMEEARKELFPSKYPAFDGRKNLYHRGPLPISNNEAEVEVRVADDERSDHQPKTFRVSLKLARNNFSVNSLIEYQNQGASTCPPQDVIQAIDIALRCAAARSFVQVGRSFFCQPEEYRDLGDGLELWLGFFQSFIVGQRPYLNIDVAHKGFPTANKLVDLPYIMAHTERDEDALKFVQTDTFLKFIRGLKVTYEIPGNPSSKRVYRVNGLVKNCLNERFEHDGRSMCVGEYFEKEKKYRVKYPQFPCVHVGSPEKTIYVPMELCIIVPGQATMKKMNETQTAAMVKIAATNVNDRKRKIRDAMRKADINNSKEVKAFGLSVAQEFEKVNGRILPPPALQYKQRSVNPARGVWRSGPFLNGLALNKWVVVDTTGRLRDDDIRKLEWNMLDEGRKLQMNIQNLHDVVPLPRCHPQQKNKELQKIFEDLKSKDIQLAVVVIASFDSQIYGQVKTAAEIHTGFLTQCIKDQTIQRRMNNSTIHNILLKVNSKLGGTNHQLQSQPILQRSEVLVLGADVTHPSPDSRDIPSVAAVTASHEVTGFQYNPQIRLQPPAVEIILDLENIVYSQLQFYRQRSQKIPKHIIFYRDGVSEGQFQQVLDEELSAIKRACKKCNSSYDPKITFLVVQKRHHTRFFPTNPRDSEDKNGNVPAGTIVDTDICHPTEVDFYLVSHASIQGVARPTKYHVLYDNSNMSENEIQLLTYGLCHLFTRCDRAVSYPAPTYYAHLAAARGRVYLEGIRVNLANLQQEEQRIQNKIFNTNPMFFV